MLPLCARDVLSCSAYDGLYGDGHPSKMGVSRSRVGERHGRLEPTIAAPLINRAIIIDATEQTHARMYTVVVQSSKNEKSSFDVLFI